MYGFRLFFRLLAGVFSRKKESLRYPSPRRLAMTAILLPVFLLNLAISWVCLWLDELFFWGYRKLPLSKAVFIIGPPRSATTFLYHLLAQDRANFTCFRLWELALAPSILQKYFFLSLRWIDRRIGNPLAWLADAFDRVVFGNFRGIHDMGIRKPEEDEALLLLIFASAYLNYFFPDSPALDALLRFDHEMPLREQDQILRFYRRCVQRHAFVFDRGGKRWFLSKNPVFMAKMQALGRAFPAGRVLFTLRSPLRVIPATISLNAHIYSGFTRLPVPYPLADRTADLMMEWYDIGREALQTEMGQRLLLLPFLDVVQAPDDTARAAYQFLSLAPGPETEAAWARAAAASRAYKSPHAYDPHIGLDEKVVRERQAWWFALPEAERM